MCGIAGIINPATPPDQDLLKRMAAPLKKRGPDDCGEFISHDVGLVHTRLSIIDLQTGRQPIFNEDDSLAIVFNGEIYDFKILRERLLSKGHRFKTHTDTEVLLHLYEDHGPELLHHVNGMFAFAIYDFKGKKLFLARDRFGQKPLFYTHSGNRFAFASGPLSLTKLTWPDTTIDPLAIHDYLEYQYIPTPSCIYRGIRKLPPGHFAIWENNQLTIEPYWTPIVKCDYSKNYTEAKNELQTKLGEAVRKRLIADVPVGLFLSGGMDSSLICALAQQQLSSSALTFSIGFPEKKYDERLYAELVAKHLGTAHHFLEVIPEGFNQLKQIVHNYEEPFCDSSMLPTSLLAHFTRQHVKVVLSGDGADELFGGYNRYIVMNLCRLFRHCPKSIRSHFRNVVLSVLPRSEDERTVWGRIRRLVEISDTEGLDQYLKVISRFPSELKHSVYGDRMRDAYPLRNSVEYLYKLTNMKGESVSVETIMEIDLKSYLENDILTKVDRASMAYGLEVRSPFLDIDVAELAMKLPHHWKQRRMSRKRILADVFKSALPTAIFKRPKMGFGVPIASWLRKDWYPKVKPLLLEGYLVNNGYFQADPICKLLEAHRSETSDYSYAIFALLVLEIWFQANGNV